MRTRAVWLAVLLLSGLGGVAGAAIINVPADQPTILDAITVAVAGDEVVLAPGTYYEGVDFAGKAITLRSTNPDDPEIVETTIIDGQNDMTVVTFDQAEGNASQLIGLTITNGAAVDGAGILCDGASPTITKNLIIANGLTTDAYGGGIACLGAASPIITNNTFKYNWAYIGGGIYLGTGANPTITGNVFMGNLADYGACIGLDDNATGTISNNTFGALPPTVSAASTGDAVKARVAAAGQAREAANAAKQGQKASQRTAEPKRPAKRIGASGKPKAMHTAAQIKATRSDLDGNSADYGGAIYGEYCTVALPNNTFVNNGAYEGGAIYGYESDITVTDSTFLRNISSDCYGGAIYSLTGTMNVSGCTFRACVAQYGGALYFEDTTGAVTDCQFDLCMSSYYGGAVYIYDCEPITLTNCDFLSCVSEYGGGVYMQDADVNLVNCQVKNCHADEGYGGGVYVYGANLLHLTDSTFDGCSAYDYAGAVYSASGGEIHADGCTFNRNLGGDYGHALYVEHSRTHLHDCTFTQNAGSYASYGTVYLNDNAFTGRELTSNGITGCLFEDNAGQRGAGVYVEAGEIDISDSTFRGNVAISNGGAIYLYGQGTIKDNLFVNNGSGGTGGAVNCYDGSYEISGNRFIGNRAYNYGDGEGGAISLGTNCWVHHNVFCGNSADNDGGAISLSGYGSQIENNSFSGNWAQYGGCIGGAAEGATITNNILAYSERGGGVYFSTNPDLFAFNDVYGNRGGNYYSGTPDMTGVDGNISVIPRYADRANCDLHLMSIGGRWDPDTETWVKDMVTSRCIDAGGSLEAFAVKSISDEPMPNAGKLNMGAYGGTQEASKSSIFSYMHYYEGQGGLARAEKITFGFFDKMVQSQVLSHFTFGEPPAVAKQLEYELSFPNDYTMIITPDPAFAASTECVARFRENIKRKDGTFTEWQEIFEWTTGKEPVIVAINPADGAEMPNSPANIVIEFDQAMATNAVQNALRIGEAGPKGKLLPGTFTWSLDHKTVTFDPADEFLPGPYDLMLTRGAKSAAGVTLPYPFRSEFAILDELAPASITAAAATAPNGTVQLTVNLTAAANVGGSVRNIAGKEIAVVPARNLPAGVSTLLWDGRSKLGTAVPAGQYLLTLSARLDDGTQCQCLAPLRK